MPNTSAAELALLASIKLFDARVVASAPAGASTHGVVLDVTDHPLRTSWRRAGHFVAVAAETGEPRFFAPARDPRNDGLTELLVAPGQAVADAIIATPAGGRLRVSAAMGDGYRVLDAPPESVLVVAAGTGFASLRPALAELITARGAARDLALVYGVRSAGDWAYRDDIERWRRQGLEAVLVAAESEPTEGGTAVDGLRGWLDDPRRTGHPPDAVLLCGPDPMQRAAIALLAERGVGRERVHLNYE